MNLVVGTVELVRVPTRVHAYPVTKAVYVNGVRKYSILELF